MITNGRNNNLKCMYVKARTAHVGGINIGIRLMRKTVIVRII